MALNYDVNFLTVRFRNALNIQSHRFRINELLTIFRECTVKEQQIFYVQLVDHIFGVAPGAPGWNLRSLSKLDFPDAFDAVLKFLYPQGPLFEIAYRLLGDVYTKFEYNICHLPSHFRLMLEQGSLPSFFMDKLQMDPVTRQPQHLHLNSYEYYMFHFVYHLVSPLQQRPMAGGFDCLDSIYLHLSDLYSLHLLPIDTSNVLPAVNVNHLTPRSPPPQVAPVKVSKLFKPSALKMMMAATPAVSQPHAEMWRSEMYLLIIIYFWLHAPEPGANKSYTMSPSNSMNTSSSFINHSSSFAVETHETRASASHLRVVRNLIKHMHFFANNVRNDGTTMDEMRRSIRSVLRSPLHAFLSHNIHHWPLDSSFKLMLETYLSYIQPWRYLKYSPGSRSGQSTEVHAAWIPFIADNLEIYTQVIIQLICRFTRMDLSSPRHADMIYRLSKVISEPELPTLLFEADMAAQRRGDTNDESLFTLSTERKVVELLNKILATVAVINEQELAVNQQRCSSSTIQTIHEWLFGSPSEDYTSSDRQATLTYLENSMRWLCRVFRVEPPEPPEPGSPAPVQPSMLDPVLASKRALFIKYGGNPDLLPIQSNECAPLVRLFHKISTSINEIHGPEIAEMWYRRDLKGRICRQLLAPPCRVHHFHKTGPGNPAPLVVSMLPPRVCLRPLSTHRFLFFIALLAFLPHLFGWTPPIFYVLCVTIFCISLVAKALLAPYFVRDTEKEPEPFIPLDVSFNE